MSGMIRVNLLKPVSSYFSCHFPTVMLLPKLSLFILLASLFLLFVRQLGLFTCGQMLCQRQGRSQGVKNVSPQQDCQVEYFMNPSLQDIWYIQEGKSWVCRQIQDIFANKWGCHLKSVNSWETLSCLQGSRVRRKERGLSPGWLCGFHLRICVKLVYRLVEPLLWYETEV